MKDQLNVAIFSVDYSSDNQCVKKKCARSLYSSFLSVMVRLRKESGTRAQNRGSGKGGVEEERRKLLCSSANWTNLSYYTNRALFTKGKHIFKAIVHVCLILRKIVYYAFLSLSNYNLPCTGK